MLRSESVSKKVRASDVSNDNYDGLSFDFDKRDDESRDSVNTHFSKGNVFPNALEYLDGDVTVTDKFGIIRGTFVQSRENSMSIASGTSFHIKPSFKQAKD
jgi:hypothetical protein